MIDKKRVMNNDCLSNRALFPDDNIEIKESIYECESIKDLQNIMRRSSVSNFKLNLMNYEQYGTIEFRQHISTFDSHKIEIWLRFLIWFVSNSIMQKRSLALNSDRNDEYAYRILFKYVIQEDHLEQCYDRFKL